MSFEKGESQLKFNSDGTINLPGSIEEDLNKQKEKMHELDIWDEPNFSENKFNLGDDVLGFNLYKEREKLLPLKFSNNKTQESVVNEILDLIKQGSRTIFVKGVCGTGKSAIALNLAKELGKASIVVPGKALQRQYHNDYTKNSYVLKENHKKLKICVITGRQNHKCVYYSGKNADDPLLPCKIEIKESNIEKLREYLKKNPRVNNNLEFKNIRRLSIAPICPYWSPIISSEYDLPLKSEKKKYLGLKLRNFTIHNRKKGCRYYNQFNSYLDGEAIVFNAAKYKIETLMNRKPKTKVEIIDECDEFLDSFSNIKKINLSRLLGSLTNLFIEDEKGDFILQKVQDLVSEILKSEEIKDFALSSEIFQVKDTKIYELLRYFLDNREFSDWLDEDSYAQNVYETARDFEDFFNDSFVCFSVEERGLIASIVTTNLAKRFAELLDKNEIIVMMSGTIHEESVLRSVFGLGDFKIIDAEIINQGKIEKLKTNLEIDCRYANFSSGRFTRKDYLLALDKAVEKSIKPTLIHVNAFDDLPSENEKVEFNLNNLMTKDKFISLRYKSEKMVEQFKKGQIDILFTTKCNRGVDFPGNQCNSIVFTKYPNPNVQNVFWKILKKTHPQYYWMFYKDKARREFLQKLYRGVRSKDDKVFVLSPDSRIFEALKLIELHH